MSKGTWWSYRVTRQRFDDGDFQYAMREVYFNRENEVVSWSADPIPVTGDSLDDIVWQISEFRRVSRFRVYDLDERRFVEVELDEIGGRNAWR